MKWIVGAIIALAAGIIIPLYIFNSNRADLKYSLSSPMTIESDQKEQNWQLLTLNNSGNSEAKKIKIKISSDVQKFKIIPFSQTDKFESKQSARSVDIEYESLPPAGTIEIRFNVPVDKIVSNSDVNIVYASGIATSTAKKGKAFGILISILWITIFACIIITAFIDCFFYYQYQLKGQAYNTYLIFDVLKMKKPFLISEKIWDEVRNNAVEHAFSSKLSSLEEYRNFLNEEKPEYLSNKEYCQLMESASDKYAESFWKHSSMYPLPVDSLIKKYQEKMPVNLSANARDSIDAQAIKLFKYNFFYCTWKIDKLENIGLNYYKLLKSDIPQEVKEDCLRVVEDFYNYRLTKEVLESEYIPNLDNICDEDIIKDDYYIKRLGYKLNVYHIVDFTDEVKLANLADAPKPPWMKDLDFEKLQKIAKKISNLDNLIKEYEFKKSSTEEKNSKLEKNILEFDEKVKIVNAQLHIIDGILKDPNSVDNIEEHSNPFAKGNFKNIIDISNILRKQKSKTGGSPKKTKSTPISELP